MKKEIIRKDVNLRNMGVWKGEKKTKEEKVIIGMERKWT